MPRWASEESKTDRNKKKNISMGFETWERLKTFGKFGDSFDDILNRLMDAGVSTSTSKPLEQLGEEPPNRLADRMVGIQEEIDDLIKSVNEYVVPEVTLHLSELKFPVNKNKIIEIVKKSRTNTKPAIEAFGIIPDKTYKNKKELLESFGKAYHDLTTSILDKAKDRIGSLGESRLKLTQPVLDPTITVSIK